VAWITKDENNQLNALGYAKNRPDPDAAYQEAGITLLPAISAAKYSQVSRYRSD
jgi:hypothetical protein